MFQMPLHKKHIANFATLFSPFLKYRFASPKHRFPDTLLLRKTRFGILPAHPGPPCRRKKMPSPEFVVTSTLVKAFLFLITIHSQRGQKALISPA